MTETAEKTQALKATISLSNLQKSLKIVSAGIERTATIPILQCLHMEQTPEGFSLISTNLDLSIRAACAESTGLESALVMPAEKLIAWTKLLAGEDVKISATERRATVQCERARAVLPIVDATDFPQTAFTSENAGITIKQSTLARALRFAMISVSPEPSRYTLNGILMQGDGKQLRAVATDGHRMTVYTLPCEEKMDDLLAPGHFVKVLLPNLADDDSTITLAVDSEKILANVAAHPVVQIASRRMTGSFPNWTAVMPKNKTQLTVNVAELLASLERCLLLADEQSGLVKFHFAPDGLIRLKAVSATNGEADETVSYSGRLDAELVTGINGGYLADVLKKLTGEIVIALPAAAGSALLFKAQPHEGETLDYIVMPMRV